MTTDVVGLSAATVRLPACVLLRSGRPSPRASVQPERPRLKKSDHQVPVSRPGIPRQPPADLVRISTLHEMRAVVPIADRAADDDDAFVDEVIHERGVFDPALLLSDSTGVVPRRPVHQRAEKVRHGVNDKDGHRHAARDARSASGRAIYPDLRPSSVSRAPTSLFTIATGSGSSIGKCSDPLVPSYPTKSVPILGSTEPLCGR